VRPAYADIDVGVDELRKFARAMREEGIARFSHGDLSIEMSNTPGNVIHYEPRVEVELSPEEKKRLEQLRADFEEKITFAATEGF
jgi:hypothetical protein